MKHYCKAACVAAAAALCLPLGTAHARLPHHGSLSGQVTPSQTASHHRPGASQGSDHRQPLADAKSPPVPLHESGVASYYAEPYDGRRAASGLIYHKNEMTAAHAWLPFGTKLRVALAGTDRSVVVTVTDRLNAPRRVLDLSLAAARELGIVKRGVAQVTLRPA